MCGIFAMAVFGLKRTRCQILTIMLTGLRRLEYRGYDSAGVAIDGLDNECPLVIKEVGTINKLEERVNEVKESDDRLLSEELRNHVSIAHTRWATHGPPSRENSHPHTSDEHCEFLVVHNGIITNNTVLRDMLQSHGFTFHSETDTETVAKLTKFIYDKLIEQNPRLEFPRLIMEVMRHLEGAFALVFTSKWYPEELVACRIGSPLVVGTKTANGETRKAVRVRLVAHEPRLDVGKATITGVAEDFGEDPNESFHMRQRGSEFLFSSDASAIVEHTDQVFYMEDNDIVHCQLGKMHVFNIHDSSTMSTPSSNRAISTLPVEIESIMKGNFPHYMLKEIYEQNESLTSSMRGRLKVDGLTDDGTITLGGIKPYLHYIRKSSRIMLLACGSSYHACLATRPVLEELADIPVSVELASDFNDRQCPISRNDTCVFVSQSGETKDTLEALAYAKQREAITVGIVNVVGSEISRNTHCGLHLNAGAEIGVASTKAYTAQIVAIVMLALQISEDRVSAGKRRQEIITALLGLPALVEKTIKANDQKMKELAERLHQEKSILLFGRGYQYATCLEGSLKIKEVSYVHTEGIHAGELKHGPIALIDDNMPVIFFTSADRTKAQIQNALQQVLARMSKGFFVIVSPDNDTDSPKFQGERCELVQVPSTVDCLQSLLSIIPMQLLSYYMAVMKGHNVDQPRNLAKSVTV